MSVDEVTSNTKQYALWVAGNEKNILGSMNQQRKENGLHHCEVRLIASGKQYFAHKIVLESHSDFFRQYLNQDRDNGNDSSQQRPSKPPQHGVSHAQNDKRLTGNKSWEQDIITIALPGITPKELEPVLEFMYTSSIVLQAENINEILFIACLLQVPAMIELCAEVLVENPNWRSALVTPEINKFVNRGCPSESRNLNASNTLNQSTSTSTKWPLGSRSFDTCPEKLKKATANRNLLSGRRIHRQTKEKSSKNGTANTGKNVTARGNISAHSRYQTANTCNVETKTEQAAISFDNRVSIDRFSANAHHNAEYGCYKTGRSSGHPTSVVTSDKVLNDDECETTLPRRKQKYVNVPRSHTYKEMLRRPRDDWYNPRTRNYGRKNDRNATCAMQVAVDQTVHKSMEMEHLRRFDRNIEMCAVSNSLNANINDDTNHLSFASNLGYIGDNHDSGYSSKQSDRRERSVMGGVNIRGKRINLLGSHTLACSPEGSLFHIMPPGKPSVGAVPRIDLESYTFGTEYPCAFGIPIQSIPTHTYPFVLPYSSPIMNSQTKEVCNPTYLDFQYRADVDKAIHETSSHDANHLGMDPEELNIDRDHKGIISPESYIRFFHPPKQIVISEPSGQNFIPTPCSVTTVSTKRSSVDARLREILCKTTGLTCENSNQNGRKNQIYEHIIKEEILHRVTTKESAGCSEECKRQSTLSEELDMNLAPKAMKGAMCHTYTDYHKRKRKLLSGAQCNDTCLVTESAVPSDSNHTVADKAHSPKKSQYSSEDDVIARDCLHTEFSEPESDDSGRASSV